MNKLLIRWKDPSVDEALPQDDTSDYPSHPSSYPSLSVHHPFPMHIDIAKLEQLSKIRLTPEEHTMLSAQIPSILEYVAKLQEVDTNGVSPASYISDLLNVWREDVVQEDSTVRDAALALFPQKKATALQVPSVGARTKKQSTEEVEN